LILKISLFSFNRKKLKEVDVIKIDVEGSEMEVLQGLKKSFKKNKIK